MEIPNKDTLWTAISNAIHVSCKFYAQFQSFRVNQNSAGLHYKTVAGLPASALCTLAPPKPMLHTCVTCT